MSSLTSSQTIGPFPHEAWQWAVATGDARPASARLLITGRLLDGQGRPIDDGWIEAWTPAAVAQEAGAVLPGFRRVPTDTEGGFALWLTPSGQPGEPAAYITVFARGLLLHLFTAVFLADDPGLAESTLLGQVPPPRRASLIAQVQADGSVERQDLTPQAYRWDIHLQGDAQAETVFFDYS